MKVISLIGTCFLLAACASKPLVIEGRYLQTGPADAPLGELALETKGTCEMFLQEFGYFLKKISRCAASSANLAWAFDIQMPIFGRMVMTARTQEGCKTMQEGIRKEGKALEIGACYKR